MNVLIRLGKNLNNFMGFSTMKVDFDVDLMKNLNNFMDLQTTSLTTITWLYL